MIELHFGSDRLYMNRCSTKYQYELHRFSLKQFKEFVHYNHFMHIQGLQLLLQTL